MIYQVLYKIYHHNLAWELTILSLRVSKWKMFIHSTESLICYLFFAFTISIALIIINYTAMRTHYKITVFTVLDPISSLLECD